MRVLVCGDREWDDKYPIGTVLRGLAIRARGLGVRLTLIEGGARGADALAVHVANVLGMGVEVTHYPADWETHGKAAGPIRNQRMLDDGKPDEVWAFHDYLSRSKGTKDMVTRARKAGVPVYLVSRVP